MAGDADNLAASLEAEMSNLTDISSAAAVKAVPKDAGGGDGDEGSGGGSNAGGADDGQNKNLSLILDIPLRVTAELGRTRMAVSELLNLGQGMVVELQKLAGEPMEIMVNDKLVARGEAVVVNEKFGVRITDILSQEERVKGLKK